VNFYEGLRPNQKILRETYFRSMLDKYFGQKPKYFKFFRCFWFKNRVKLDKGLRPDDKIFSGAIFRSMLDKAVGQKPKYFKFFRCFWFKNRVKLDKGLRRNHDSFSHMVSFDISFDVLILRMSSNAPIWRNNGVQSR